MNGCNQRATIWTVALKAELRYILCFRQLIFWHGTYDFVGTKSLRVYLASFQHSNIPTAVGFFLFDSVQFSLYTLERPYLLIPGIQMSVPTHRFKITAIHVMK